MQYCLDKKIARSGGICEDDSGLSSLVMFRHHKHLGANFFIRIAPKHVYAEAKSFVNKFNMHVSSSLMPSLHAIVICQKILQKYCDIVLNPSFCTSTCNEALCSVTTVFVVNPQMVGSKPDTLLIILPRSRRMFYCRS